MMKPDAFALLGLPRRAVLDAGEVRAAFQQAAAPVHPDGAGNDEDRERRTAQFAALNEAQATLTSLPQRLRHLLALEFPDTAAARTGVIMEGTMMDLFSTVAAAVQGAAAVQTKKQKAATALAKAMLAGEEMAAREVAVSSLATVYALSGGDDAAAQQLGVIIASQWSLATALSLLAWYVFAPQCLSTLAVIKRETNSWRNVAIATGYLFALAYLASFITFQIEL